MSRGFRFEENGEVVHFLALAECLLTSLIPSWKMKLGGYCLLTSLITERWNSGQRLKGGSGNCTKRTCSGSQRGRIDVVKGDPRI